jgi:hypothetical protein
LLIVLLEAELSFLGRGRTNIYEAWRTAWHS